MPGGGGDGGMPGGGGGGNDGGGGDGGGGPAACTTPTEHLGFGSFGVAVDATTIYYDRWTYKTGDDTLFSRPKDLSGSEQQVALLDAGNTRAYLLVDGLGVYAISVGCVKHVFLGGGGTSLACVNTGFVDFTDDAAAVYGLGDNGAVWAIGKNVNTTTQLTTDLPSPHGIAVAGGRLYIAADGHILAMATSGGALTEIVHDAAGATRVAADAARVYWGDAAGRIWSAPATPNATPTQLAQVGLGVTRLTSDDTRLYWAAQQDANDSIGNHLIDAIEEMGKDGTGLRELDPRVVGIHQLTVDDSSVYWTADGVARHCK
jgi:hypothetical protein